MQRSETGVILYGSRQAGSRVDVRVGVCVGKGEVEGKDEDEALVVRIGSPRRSQVKPQSEQQEAS